MANNFSDYTENKIINHLFMNSTYTPATQHFIALFTASTGLETNLPTGEVSGGAYARCTSTFNTATAGTSVNGGTLTWAEATADWGTITHLAIVDHVTNVTWGTNVNVLMWGTLTASKTVSSGDTFKISAGDLSISVE
jgi:hypothetical protein